MAGAILISILLISIGIMIFNKNSGMVEQSNSVLDTITSSNAFEEATTIIDPVKNFNSQFTKYFGDSVSGARTKEFVKAVIKNNSNSNNPQILLNLYHTNGNHMTPNYQGHNDTLEELQDLLDLILNKNTYIIKPTDFCETHKSGGGYDTEGYIRCMSIKLN